MSLLFKAYNLMIEDVKNIVLYLLIDEIMINRKPKYIAGLHGYTYIRDEEGKKSLKKGVPTTTGYYIGNPRHVGGVVNIKEYFLGTVSNGQSLADPALSLLRALLEFLDKEENRLSFKNVCIVSKYQLIEKLLKVDLVKLEANKWVMGKHELSADEQENIKAVNFLYNQWTKLGNKIIFDTDTSVEGGIGMRLASKQSGLGKIETIPNGVKRVFFETMSKKEYEDPQNDFNKIVNAGRWYFNTGEGSDFYDDFHGYRSYSFGAIEPDKKYYGKLTPDVTFSNLYVKTPIQLLDKIFNYAKKLIPNPNEYLSAGILRNVVGKDVARIVDTYPGAKLGKNLVIPFESSGKEEPTLVELIDPPVMSYQVRNSIQNVHHLFDVFKGRDENNVNGRTSFKEITDLIYEEETNKKGVVKRKLNSELKQNTAIIKIDVNHPKAVKPVPITLSLGFDLPERNNFNSCLTDNVKVWVGTDVNNPSGIRYYCVVECDEWVYIQMSAVAGIRVLSVKELGITVPKKEEAKK